MPFIGKKEAFEILDEMENGTCIKSCRQVWLRNIGYALKTKTNPLRLTATEHKRMTRKITRVKGRKASTQKTRKVEKKYTTRPSPALPANEYCGKTRKGNDGNRYKSVPNKNGICRWVQV